MIDITFKLNGTDYSSFLSTYTVSYETEYENVITTLNGTEYGVPRYRPVLTVSFIPLTEAQSAALYTVLNTGTVTVLYTDTYKNTNRTASMRVTSNLESQFGLSSINGNRYYKGGSIILRQRTVI